jgi:type II secretory pathway component PulF
LINLSAIASIKLPRLPKLPHLSPEDLIFSQRFNGFPASAYGQFMGGVSIIAIILAVFIVPAISTMFWNITMPAISRLPRITYWQGLVFVFIVSVLSTALFGGGLHLNLNSSPGTSQSSFELDNLRRDVWTVSEKIDRLEQLRLLNQKI